MTRPNSTPGSSPGPRSGPKITAALLGDVGVFGGLDEESLALLAAELPTVHAEAGETVVGEGDTSREMFIVVGGELEVVKESKSGKEARVALFGPGDWFGEMSILEPAPRSATVRAVAPTMLVRVSNEHIERLLYRRDLKAYSLFLMNIARELSRRLRVADGIVAQLVTAVSDEYVTKRRR